MNKELKFCENSKKKNRGGGGGQGGCEHRSEFFVKIQQQKSGSGESVRVDLNKEWKFCEN